MKQKCRRRFFRTLVTERISPRAFQEVTENGTTLLKAERGALGTCPLYVEVLVEQLENMGLPYVMRFHHGHVPLEHCAGAVNGHHLDKLSPLHTNNIINARHGTHGCP